MPYKLDKQELAQKLSLELALTNARSKLEDDILVLNQTIAAAINAANDAVSLYNETVNEALGFCEDIATERRGEWDDMSDKWQNGDNGQNADSWIGRWEYPGIEELEPFEEFELDISDHEVADAILEELPED
jgi:hypothetical protein